MKMIDVKAKNFDELATLAEELRGRILDVVSNNGGHLSSSLGAVDLIIAMHKVFDVNKDPFIFDVSHQAYAHKLLTNRWDTFEGLRKFGGISGFTRPDESEHDYFIAGHSSTSISLGVGAAKAIKLNNEDKIPIALIGDGALSAGMAYEAMNELGEKKYPMIIIINDNEMSIARPIGAISNYLSRIMAGEFFQNIKHRAEKMLHGNKSMEYLAKRVEESFKLITPGILFEELGLDYIGPVDGHNIEELCDVLETAKTMKKAVVVHAQTTKGKGYDIAQGKHEQWHGVGPFDIETGKINSSKSVSCTQVFSQTLLDLASKNEKIVGITAAMPSGTGMGTLIEKFPDRFWDVGIAEQHAVTSAASLAKEGFKPFVVIYSTFLQRAYDQIIHDVCIMNLGVVFAIDRSGVVGEDGETHQGLFDVSYLKCIPNMTILAPRDLQMLEKAVHFASTLNSPCAIRYPRGNFCPHTPIEAKDYTLAQAQILTHDGDSVIFGFGNGTAKALCVREKLLLDGINIRVVDLCFIKPIDKSTIIEQAKNARKVFVISDNVKLAGVGEEIMRVLNEAEIYKKVISFEYPDSFVTHGSTQIIQDELGQSCDKITRGIKKELT